MRFYGKAPLSNHVVVEVARELDELTRPAFEPMQQEQPDSASRLEGHIIRVLCDSLLRREQQLRVMRCRPVSVAAGGLERPSSSKFS